MPNVIRGEVPLKLSDGRELSLVLDMEALVEAEGAYGKPLQAMMADASVGFVGAVRAMLFGALRAKHPAVTLRDASTMFQTDGEAVSSALERAATAAFPTGDGVEGQERENPPGTSSGSNGAEPDSIPKPSGAKRRARSA